MFAEKGTIVAGLKLAPIFAVCLLLVAGCAKKDDPVVIKMKGKTLTLSDIKEAYDRVNGEGFFDNATIPERQEFAETWANKEILLSEARKHVKEPSKTTKLQLVRYRERFLEVAYWRQMSEGVTLPEDTLSYYRDVSRKQMLLSVIQVSTDEEAEDLLRRVRAGESFETLARLHSEDRYTKEAGGRTGWVGMGGGNLPIVETFAFENLEKGQLCDAPVQTPKGFFIVRVDDVRILDPTPELEQQWRATARQSYFRNRTRAIKDSVLLHHNYEVHSEALEPLTRGFYDFWDSLNVLQATTGGVPYMSLDPPSRSYWSSEEWSMPAVSFDGETWTIGDLVESLRECDLEFWLGKNTDEDQTRRNIERRMLRHFMVKDATDWGWEKKPWYKERYDRRVENRLLEDYYEEVLAKEVTITDEEIQKYRAAHEADFTEDDMIDFGFLLFPPDGQEQAEEALKALRRGGDWNDIGQNQMLSNPGVSFVGATGLNASDQYPELAYRAKGLVDTGRLPLNTYSDLVRSQRGWAVLRVTSRVRGNPMPAAVAESFIRKTLTDQGIEAILQERIPALRTEYGLEIFTAPLESDLIPGKEEEPS